MEEIRAAAHFCIGRAVGFAGLAISVIMISCSFDFTISLKMGLALTLAMTSVLFWHYQTAHTKKPERSEVWITLPVEYRPKNEASRDVFRRVMAETYLFYTVRAFSFSLLMLALWAAFELASLITGQRIGLT